MRCSYEDRGYRDRAGVWASASSGARVQWGAKGVGVVVRVSRVWGEVSKSGVQFAWWAKGVQVVFEQGWGEKSQEVAKKTLDKVF